MFNASQSVPAYSDEFRTPFRFKADSVPIQAGHRSDWSRTVFRPKADGFRAPSEWGPSGLGTMSDLDRNGVRMESERCPNRAGNHVLGAPIRAGEASPLRGGDRRRRELEARKPSPPLARLHESTARYPPERGTSPQGLRSRKIQPPTLTHFGHLFMN